RHNQVFQQTNYQVHYFEMRAAQSKILRTMATNINKCLLEARENIILASLFERTAQQLSRENSAKELLLDIELFHATFRERPLPQTREEFETRATLFQLLHDMEHFIQLKVDFYQAYSENI
ncbi:MAG TPA: aromatic acid exporter family protein, partial [Streptococcus sp.]|nr:aromatic acid exporter family protein [Streptococcus sp.]